MTLILSASDFTILDAGTLELEITGTARLHADIDSAAKGYDSGSLPSSSYCREYALDQGFSGAGNYVTTAISGSVESGAYSGSLGDNAVSVRAWVRLGTTVPFVGIFVKNPSTFSVESNSYMLRLNNTTLLFIDDAGATSLTKTRFTNNEWHRIRLDYIPIASMKDVINVYTSSAGGTNTETWELIGSTEILNTDPGYITASNPALTMGYACRGYDSVGGHFIWIDDFDVYVTPAG